MSDPVSIGAILKIVDIIGFDIIAKLYKTWKESGEVPEIDLDAQKLKSAEAILAEERAKRE